jgi:hypothetical protein
MRRARRTKTAVRQALEQAQASAQEEKPTPSIPPEWANLPTTATTGLIALLRQAHRVDPVFALGDQARWESVVAAVIAVLVRKGLVTEEEILEELMRR